MGTKQENQGIIIQPVENSIKKELLKEQQPAKELPKEQLAEPTPKESIKDHSNDRNLNTK